MEYLKYPTNLLGAAYGLAEARLMEQKPNTVFQGVDVFMRAAIFSV